MASMANDDTEMIWQEACAAALAGLPKMGPATLRALLTDMTPDVAWAAVAQGDALTDAVRRACRGKYDDHHKAWRTAARKVEPLHVLDRYRKLGIEVWTPFTHYPARLVNDEYAPVVLFAQGNTAALDCTTVGIIGTRRCTYEGRAVASIFGRELAEAGIAVMSGLALGIDGAAHLGALAAPFGAPPIAIVGNGLDLVYPPRHKELWNNVRTTGLIISESPLGAQPEQWRFPARNRILAGLCDVLLVIESHERGGSLITAREALDRGKVVMAVPGSIQKPASVGTNRLLNDGALMACEVGDVLMALAEFESVPEIAPLPEPELDNVTDEDVLEAIDWVPTTTDEVMARTGLSLGEISPSLARLAQLGWLIGGAGWWQRSAPSWS